MRINDRSESRLQLDHSDPQARPITVLATDLDGTFLGGSMAARQRLYEFIENHRESLTLIFVTGRDLPFIRRLVETSVVPNPDFVIGDVGTSITGPDWEPVDAIQSWVESRWNGANEQVEAMLDGVEGLRLQPTPFERRVSYFFEPGVLSDEVPETIRNAGFDCLLSADTYLDVLPRGVHKGSTLLRLLEHTGLSNDQTLVAGDTLNDRAMFETGLPGVVVGGAEPALVDAVSHLPRTWCATAEGCGGIWQALDRLDALEHHRSKTSRSTTQPGVSAA